MVFALMLLALTGTPDVAPPARTAPPSPVAALGPTLEQSLKLAQAALDACHARGYDGSVAVVDSAGLVKVILRADTAPKPPVAAPMKAAAAAAFDLPGSEMEPRAATDAAFAAQLAAHKDIYNDHPGSIPLHRDGRIIGGLAVADVPHDVADTCARAAVAAAWPH